MTQLRGTTVLAVRRHGRVVIGADGQVSLGNTVMKGNARKVRRLYKDKIIAGFAGGTADAFTLFERFEGQLEKHSGNLTRAAVELAKDWRTDRALRRLEALLIVADAATTLLLSGTGDVIEPEYDLAAIGSGGWVGGPPRRCVPGRRRGAPDQPLARGPERAARHAELLQGVWTLRVLRPGGCSGLAGEHRA